MVGWLDLSEHYPITHCSSLRDSLLLSHTGSLRTLHWYHTAWRARDSLCIGALL